MTKKLPRGIRNNNPGNIERGDPWQGLRPVNARSDPRFAEFTTPAYGIRALARTLITYQDKHNIRTVKAAINRWAPPVENDTGAYVQQVRLAVGGDIVDLHSYDYLKPMVEAIIRHENGQGPLKNANTWYDAATIDEGLRLAGVRPVAPKLPVTTEAVGATAVGGVGVVEIADALPDVISAIKGAEGHLTSGSTVRVVIGVVLIAAAAFIAYSQIKRYRTGQL